MAPCPDRSAKLGIQRLDGVRRIQNPPDIAGEGVERDDLAPGTPLALPDGRIFLTPEALLEGAKRGFAGIGIDSNGVLTALGILRSPLQCRVEMQIIQVTKQPALPQQYRIQYVKLVRGMIVVENAMRGASTQLRNL
jgi:hypothetical protein